MDTKPFDYTQKWKRRVVDNPLLRRFIWDYFNFGTTYNEPYGNINLTNNSSDGYVFAQSTKPVRVFELDFPTMIYTGEDENYAPKPINFNLLIKFYLEHGCHKPFIFNHPVYGDTVVRFSKPLVMPKKTVGGSGAIQNFSITLAEIIDTDYIFQRGEDFSGTMPFHCEYYDVEMEYVEDTLVAPLGGNYHMIFKKTRPPLRTLSLSIQGMQYFFNAETDTFNITHFNERNMALLEIFYLKHRLTEVFNFEYGGEVIPVRFKEPLTISKVSTNTGVLDTIQITLIEAPYQQLKEEDIK